VSEGARPNPSTLLKPYDWLDMYFSVSPSGALPTYALALDLLFYFPRTELSRVLVAFLRTLFETPLKPAEPY
jgi:hypothetical protein